MISLECVRARSWIDRGAVGLGDVERLRLEDHLTDCATCASDADALNAFRGLVETTLPAGSENRRRRAVLRALAATPAAERELPRRRYGRLGLPALGGAFAVAAAVALALALGPEASPIRAPGSTPPAPRATDVAQAQILAGSLLADGVASMSGQDVRAGIDMASVGATRVRLGAAELALHDRSVFRWEPERTTVRLYAGALRARVEKLDHGTFRVATERFVVVVTGTRFSVTPDRVDVEEGSVRVEAPDGRVLQPALLGGESWTERADEESAAERSVGTRKPDPHWLATARQRLSAGDVSGAREAISRARPARLPRRERAEAETLRAECAQVDGDLEDAMRRYLRVAKRYRELRAGDNALFAAARVAATRGDRALERRLLERYLAEHPRGRFRLEAARRLGREVERAEAE